jgi:putative ABC transport system permease protein
MRLAVSLARRELRGGLAGFRIFLACLALGVAAIAAVQSVAAGIRDGLRRDGQAILGGDLSVRTLYTPATAEQVAFFRERGEVSVAAEMRSMARNAAGASTLVELKVVDPLYPLYGTIALEGGLALEAALAERGGTFGAVAEEAILARLGLAVGDRVRVGEAEFELRALIAREPDRAAGGAFVLGPRLMIAEAAVASTGLMQPGSMITWNYRVRLPEGADAAATAEAIGERFPGAGWRVRDFTNASPSLERTIDRLALFLTLVGLTALLVGGVGVGNAVKSHLDGRIATIATLKCLGAGGRLVFQTYLVQIMALAAVGIAGGLLIGAAVPFAARGLLASLLPVPIHAGIYPSALAIAAAFGALTALAFSLWPLARAREVPAGSLFRDVVAPIAARPRPVFIAATAAAALALAGLAVASAEERWFASWFVLGSAAAILAFRLAAWGIIAAARRIGRPRRPGLRLAIANLHRPGAPTPDVVLSLGLGLTVLVTIALVEGNMSRQVRETLPADAPSYFFIDIQPSQREAFNAALAAIDGVFDLEEVPSLRGRIVRVNGRPAEEALVSDEFGWLLRGDRGVTYSAVQRPGHDVVAGAWWPADYAGPPLISVYEEIAEAFGIGIGDTLTVNVLGRDIDAQIASIRAIDWESLELNFTMVFSPVPLSAAPHTLMATVHTATDAAEEAVIARVAADFPNVTAIRVKEALETVNGIVRQVATAVTGIAGVTLVAGTLVLAGAIAAGHRRRVYESVVLKVLGATRAAVLRAFAIEYGLLGLVTAGLAAIVGTIAAWAVITQVMEVDWVFIPQAVAATAALSAAVTIGFGFVGTWRALGQKAAPLLRNE